MSSECERSGYFLHIPPRPYHKGAYLMRIDLRTIPHPAEKSSEIAKKNHPNMANAPNSSSCPHGSEKGDCERCFVSHSQLSKLRKQGFLPPSDIVPVRAVLTSFNGGVQAENFPNPSRGTSMLCSLLAKRRRISNPSLPPRTSGVLWPPTA